MSWNEVCSALGEPYYATDVCRLYNRDCLEAMGRIVRPFVDLTVTSPPYNIGKEYEAALPTEVYVRWCEQWINEVHRLTNPSGAFWLNLGYCSLAGRAKAIPLPYLLWDRVPFYLVQEIVWNYGAGVAGRRFFSPRNEKFLWYVRNEEQYTFNLDDVRDPNVKYPHQRKNGKVKCNPMGKNPSDVWQFPKVTSGQHRSSPERTPHPAQFPLDVITRIIAGCSDRGEIVMDPFMGSGTTAVAAIAQGRRVVGFEIRESYCALSKQRIEDYIRQERYERLQTVLSV